MKMKERMDFFLRKNGYFKHAYTTIPICFCDHITAHSNIDNMSKYEDEDWKDLSEDVKEAGECRFLEERVKA